MPGQFGAEVKPVRVIVTKSRHAYAAIDLPEIGVARDVEDQSRFAWRNEAEAFDFDGNVETPQISDASRLAGWLGVGA